MIDAPEIVIEVDLVPRVMESNSHATPVEELKSFSTTSSDPTRSL